MDAVLEIILGQINSAEADLDAYEPTGMGWYDRAITTAQDLIPVLVEVAPGLKDYVQNVLNAPAMLRTMWTTIGPEVKLPKEQLEAFDRQLAFDDVLRESVGGETVSKVVTNYLLEKHPGSALASNSRSDYPDIYFTTADYSQLPASKRGKDVEYGAALKGKKTKKKPARVPDGLEIKTCRKKIKIDCHHPHPGMHLAVVFTEVKRFFTVIDLQVAFLRKCDYREAGRNTTATTVKYSFNGDRFVSLLTK